MRETYATFNETERLISVKDEKTHDLLASVRYFTVLGGTWTVLEWGPDNDGEITATRAIHLYKDEVHVVEESEMKPITIPHCRKDHRNV